MKNNFTYEILKLSDIFYNDFRNSQYQEMLAKRNRPYNVVLFKTSYDYFIVFPFRTKLNHNNGFHFYPNSKNKENNPGLDYSKAVIIKNIDYIGENVLIDKKQIKNIEIIHKEISKYIDIFKEHINGAKVLNDREFKRKYKYSTLKCFHNELDL